jgi:hypothetical protein
MSFWIHTSDILIYKKRPPEQSRSIMPSSPVSTIPASALCHSPSLFALQIGRIDVHHHFFPATLNKKAASASVGFRTPESSLPWTPEVSIKCMNELNIQTAVLCLPLNSSGSVGTDNRAMMREHNLYAHQVCRDHPGRFEFFAGVGFLDDIKGSWRSI